MNEIMKIVKLLGRQRAILLGILLGINVLVVLLWFFALDPMREEAQTQLNAEEAKVRDLRNKIANTKQEVAYVKENLPAYQGLQDRGFFLDQDRFMIGRLLEDMRKKTELESFSFNIDDLTEIPNADAETAKQRLVKSHITIQKVASVFDSNIYAFLQDIAAVFPETTRIQKFDMKRVKEVNETSLNEIVEGKPVTFIDAGIEFDWITMVPKREGMTAGAGGR